MSRATKTKHVTKEVLENFLLPEKHQQIVKVVSSRGNNLHEVTPPHGDNFLVSMPTKFRKNVWIKRGDYIIVEPISEGDRVRAEIVQILYKEQIKYIKEEKMWPSEFLEETTETEDCMIPSDMLPPNSDSDDDDNDLFVNKNRMPTLQTDSDSSSDESEHESKLAAETEKLNLNCDIKAGDIGKCS